MRPTSGWIPIQSLVLALVALVLGGPATARADEAAWLFEPDRVVEIDFTLSDDARAALEADPGEYVDAGFELRVDGAPMGDPLPVGLRLKGSSSFRGLDGKAAFKVKFAHSVGGQRFAGLKSLTLNNMVQDPSMIHERLAYEVFRAAGIPAPRTGYAFVRVNGEPYGLYLNVETIDDVALERWFDSTGHLYEGEYGADVSPAAIGLFQVEEGDEDDLGDLEALTAALAAPDPGFSERMRGLADLGEMTRMWAVERYIGHWDGYTATPAPNLWPNNYYLHSTAAGEFTMLPWGTDQTFVRRVRFDEPGGALFNACLAEHRCRALYLDQLATLPALAASLDLDRLAAETASALDGWQAQDPRREYSLTQIAAAVEATRAFIAARPRDLMDPAYWEPRRPPDRPPADLIAPETKIKRAPAARVSTRKRRAAAEFRFSSSEPNSRFECRRDAGPWRSCKSPLRLRVGAGRHVLRVRAIDAAGNVDPTPARHRWSVRRLPAR